MKIRRVLAIWVLLVFFGYNVSAQSVSCPPPVIVMADESGTATVTLVFEVDPTPEKAATVDLFVNGQRVQTTTVVGPTQVFFKFTYKTGDSLVTVVVSTKTGVATCDTAVIVLPPLINTPGAKVTGGGFIAVKDGKATFGLQAQVIDLTAAKGHFTYHDHLAGISIKSTSISSVAVVGRHARIIGEAEFNDGLLEVPVKFVVDVDDISEPSDLDTFAIELTNGYVRGGRIEGGNIQVHEQ